MNLSPLNRRRFERFKANKRGWWSLWLFLILFGLSLGAELIANDKPLVVHYDGDWYFPALKRYPETTFGGEFPLEANYKSPYIQELQGQGRVDAVGADPVQLSEHQLRPEGTGPRAAVFGQPVGYR